MKLIIKSLATIFVVSTMACESSGGVWLGEDDNFGNPYTFGPNQDVEMLKNLAKAYSEKNVEKLSSYYSQEYMNKTRKENYSKWLNSMESITMKPYKIIPLRNGDFKQVIAWSKEERISKNGSYEKLDLMESFILGDDGKVESFKQWKAIDSVNFGMTYGGKFFGKEQNSNTGSPFVFSNRNETKIIEDFVASYNKMDVDGMKNALAEEFTLDDYRGKKVKYKKSELDNFFKPFISVNWKLNAIIPIKIANTDAASGVIVRGTESRVLKNGRKWKKDLMEIYYFDLEGKISSMEQFAK